MTRRFILELDLGTEVRSRLEDKSVQSTRLNCLCRAY